jgi:NADH:ubiquinone oxidoreductase subunit K
MAQSIINENLMNERIRLENDWNGLRELAIAAAEVGVGLAMVLLMYRNRRSVGLDELSEMKG